MSVSPISPLSTGTGNLFPDSSTHAPCGFHTARTLSGSLCSPPSPSGEGFSIFPEPSSWAVDNSLCEIISARKEEEWVEGSPRKAATFDGDTENIFAWFIFIGSCCIRRSGRRIWLFSSISAWILPQKIEKRGFKKSNEALWKKCVIVSYFRRKNKAEQLHKTQDGGGVTIY